MRIIPALFLQNGKVVSLYKGTDNPQKKVYSKLPVTYAESFHVDNAKTLFVIDLDGDQRERLKELKAAFPGELWWAGEVRTLEAIDWLLANGADRIVLGQGAEPIFEAALAKHGPEKLIAGIQAFHYTLVPDLSVKRVEQGFQDIFVKDMNAEGTLFQPNFDLMEKCVYFSKANIYASGGISKEQDIRLLGHAGVKGVVIGRALYEHQLNLASLVRHFESA